MESAAMPTLIRCLGFTNEDSVNKDEYDTVLLVAEVLTSLSFVYPSSSVPSPLKGTMEPNIL